MPTQVSRDMLPKGKFVVRQLDLTEDCEVRSVRETDCSAAFRVRRVRGRAGKDASRGERGLAHRRARLCNDANSLVTVQ